MRFSAETIHHTIDGSFLKLACFHKQPDKHIKTYMPVTSSQVENAGYGKKIKLRLRDLVDMGLRRYQSKK